MKKRVLRLLFLSGTLLSLLTACEYDYIVPTPPPPVIVGDTISFSKDVQPVFTSQCVTCHKTGGKAPDLSTGRSYSALINGNYVVVNSPTTSTLYLVCKPGGSGGKDMSSYISSNQLDLISRWINAGAKND